MTPKKKEKAAAIRIFSDFDGTITQHDTGVVIIDHAMTTPVRRSLDLDILHGRRTFRSAVEDMWLACNFPFSKSLELLKNTSLDPYFEQFHSLLLEKNIHLNVLSAGLEPLCDLYLGPYLVENGGVVSVFANSVRLPLALKDQETHTPFKEKIQYEDGLNGWKIVYRDDTDFGNDKGSFIRNELNKDVTVVFIGDGVSDLSAARDANVVFAKRGKDLAFWCEKEGIPCYEWDSFKDIIAVA